MSGRRVKKDYTNPLLQSTTEPDTADQAQPAAQPEIPEQSTPAVSPAPPAQVPVEEVAPAQEPELPAQPLASRPPVAIGPSPEPLPDHTRMRYPEGDGYDKRNEYLPTYVVRGIRALVDDLVKKSGQTKTTLSSVAWIMLLEDSGYDMSAFKEKLPHYYRLKEMEAMIKSLEEQHKGGAKKRKSDG